MIPDLTLLADNNGVHSIDILLRPNKGIVGHVDRPDKRGTIQ